MCNCYFSYLKRTKVWRGKNKSQLLLSFVKPHNPVVSSAISGWIKNFLREAVIYIKIFKGHSASSTLISKAGLAGLSVAAFQKEVFGLMLQPDNGFITDRLSHLQKKTKIKFQIKNFEQEGKNGLEYDKRAQIVEYSIRPYGI